MKLSDLNDNYMRRLQAMADESGVKMSVSREYDVIFEREGDKDILAAIAPTCSYGYYIRSNQDRSITGFVVSGRFLPKKSVRSRDAFSPWQYNYTKAKDLEKALHALKQALRGETEEERVYRLGFECRRRWNINDWAKRFPQTSAVEKAVLALYRDGCLPNALNDERVRDQLDEQNAEMERYIGQWLAEEIISISEKVERKMVGVADE